MGYFGEDFAKGFFGPGDGLKDYTHASKTFTTDGYSLSPRFKFLFHVYFTINTGAIKALQNIYSGGNEISTIGLAVKTIDLPSYTIGVDTMNQYNRKRLVQSKIDYNPIQIVFHDDQGDLIRNMWYNYYSYYYKDPSQPYDNVPATAGTAGNDATTSMGSTVNARDIYSNSINNNFRDWGFVGESYGDGSQPNQSTTNPAGKPPFFRDIKIYAINQKKFASYVLINPVITDFKHDTFDYSQNNGTMTHTMTLKYETVKYYNGAIGAQTPSSKVLGFADPAHYDTTKSSIARAGGTATVFGQGGLLDAAGGGIEDLAALASGEGGIQNVLGLVQKAGTAYNTFKGKDIKSIALQEAKAGAQAVLLGALPSVTRLAINTGNGMFFPDGKGGSTAPNVGTNTRANPGIPNPLPGVIR